MLYCEVAHHTFGIEIREEELFLKRLPMFLVFLTEPAAEKDCLFVLHTQELGREELTSPTRMLDDNANDVGHWKLYETATGYRVDLAYDEKCYHTLLCSADFHTCQAYLNYSDPDMWNVLNSYLMIAYAQSCTAQNTATIHASVVMKDGKGYAFLGTSGTGKSTHSKLWMKHIEGVELLNDDNPALRVMDDGTIHIFGTPWSGKTPCYKNVEVELGGIVQLKQAPQNKIARLKGLQAFITLQKSCSSLKWNHSLYTALGNTVEIIANRIPVFYLENRPDEEAAQLSYCSLAATTVPRM